jgi:diacylglycerol kinase
LTVIGGRRSGLHPSQHPSIKIAKGMAAGAVLRASLAALGSAHALYCPGCR